MAFKILEKNGVDNENVDGGAFNRFTAGGRDGIVQGVLNECTLTAIGNGVGIAPGLIILCGIRVKITAQEALYVSHPANPTQYQIIMQAALEKERDLEVTIFLRSFSALVQQQLYADEEGIYQVEIGSFTANPDGSITDLIRTLDVITGPNAGRGDGNIEVGNVVTDTLAAGLDAEVDVSMRRDEENKKLLLDFSFKIPEGRDALTYDNVYYSTTDVVAGTTQIIQERSKFNRTPVIGEDCSIVFTWMNDPDDFQAWITYQAVCEVIELDNTYVTLRVNGAVRITGAQGDSALTYDTIYYSAVPVAVGNLIIQENEKFNRAAALGDDITISVAQTTSSPFRTFIVAGTVTAIDSAMTTITVRGFCETTGAKGDKGDTGGQGVQGIPGVTPNVKAGTTTTLQAGASAQVKRRSGSPDSDPIFDFEIPKGDKGDQGVQGATGAQGIQGEKGDKGEKGDRGDSGVTVPVNGFFTMSVDADGNLWIHYEGSDPPPFSYDAASGNLYYTINDGR